MNDPAIFFDTKLISIKTLEFLDPDKIETINVIKKDTPINKVSYHGQLYITSKNPEQYDFISLEEIKADFTKINSNDVVYMINGKFIKENLENIKLDRNDILDVEVTNSEAFYNSRKSDAKFDIINILGKTKENLENKNKILIRGQEVIGVK
ncbi:hypothetical protein [Flavobacterium xinjiangense]|nr:hypothetical protein [Flavobacterium xinjiangense]